MRSTSIVLLSCLVLAANGRGQTPSVTVVRLAPQASKGPTRALQYALLPEPADQVPGNAAPLWLSAGLAARVVQTRMGETQWKWLAPEQTPLKTFPRQEARDFLKNYERALRLAAAAAQRVRCDWEFPTPTIQTLYLLPMEEIQGFRELASLLSLQARLELAEGDYAKAVAAVRIGLTLARHVGQGDTLIQSLVGIAITAIMLNWVEEMMQVPGSPNFYWPLTALPSSLIDIRDTVRTELNSYQRSFPLLFQAVRQPLPAEGVNREVEEFTRILGQLGEKRGQPRKQNLAVQLLKLSAEARQKLQDQGRTKEELALMPALQVVVIYLVEEYGRFQDDYLKGLNLPSWQMWQEVQRQRRALLGKGPPDNPMIGLLLPALEKTQLAQLRLQLQIAGMRGAEALRLYAAAHQGRPPEKWADLKEVPLPINPFTGEGLDSGYRLVEGKGVLEIKPQGPEAWWVRQYEWSKPEGK